jgi:ABC-2 type transport system permease protein
MNTLVRAEWRKITTVRLPLIAFAVAAGAAALTAVAIITTAGRSGNPPLDRHSLTATVHGPFAIVAGTALLLGILGVAGEFRHQTITSNLLVAPRRGRLLMAKVLTHAGLGAIVALLATVVSLAVAVPWLNARGVPPSDAAALVKVLAGGIIAAALFGSAGAGLGALIANQTAAIAISLVWLLAVEGLLVDITSKPALHNWLPGGALDAISTGGGTAAGVSLLAATSCAIAYTSAFVAAGARRFVTRDIT